MPKSNGRRMFGRGSGTVAVIEEPVRRSSIRNAKITFWVTWTVTALIAANIAASKWHPPIVALLAGILIALVPAVILFILVAIWPVLRVLLWWLPEITITTGVVLAWIQLAEHTSLLVRLSITAVVVGVPAAVKPARRYISALVWCLITRHRIRTCFSEFISNRIGSLPFILWAHPTSVGKRAWIWLRPGLALDDLRARLDKFAVGCWASAAFAEPASASNAALVRMDIKRRDALTGTVVAPLLGILGSSNSPAAAQDTASAPSALDLPDITAEDVTPAKPAPITRAAKKPATPVTPVPAATSGSDVEDWI